MDTIDCPKCEHEHNPCGCHEDDVGEFECEKCGFEFNVDIDYDPSYTTSCMKHEFDKYKMHKDRSGNLVECRFCIHCGRCELK